MKFSIKSAQGVTKTDISSSGVDEIVRRIGEQLGSVENVIDWGSQYKGVVVAKVVNCKKHPNADKLSICLIDDGGKVQEIDRDENNFVQVVCGAPNIQSGLTVAWLPPGATVPSTYNDSQPFVLGSRELRGVISNGMIASASELGISDDHTGILELHNDIAAGTPFSSLFALDDTVIDLENKMFTHRPDCFGVIGVARELAGIQHKQFISPDWYINEPVYPITKHTEVSLSVDTDLVSRFCAIVLDNINIAPSPLWMQVDLTKVGIRPINNIVDITNWLMHMTGQPLHAYDYDKIVSKGSKNTANLTARMSKKNDKLVLLNGKEITFEGANTILICSHDEPIGIGGVMGGADTEVDNTTKKIIFECATFDMYSIRRTSMKYGLFTDAVTRFNKGQSPLQNSRIIAKAVDLAAEMAGGKVQGTIVDYKAKVVRALPNITLEVIFINERLGLDLKAIDIKTLLENVEFKVAIKGKSIEISVPFWRRDIHIAEDIVEEVGRLYGYNKLPICLPSRSAGATKTNRMTDFKSQIREILSACGSNEVISYNFIHQNILLAANQNIENAFQLSNAISPDLQYYRLSVMPSLLDKIHMNIKAGFGKFALFEIGKSHSKTLIDNDGLPLEAQRLAFVFGAEEKNAKSLEGDPYYHAKIFLDTLASKLNITLKYEPFLIANSKITNSDTAKPLFPLRSAIVRSDKGIFLGVIGEFTSKTSRTFKLPAYCAGFEIELGKLHDVSKQLKSHYVQLPKYPKVTQDVTIQVENGIVYSQVYSALRDGLDTNISTRTHYELLPLDIYEISDSISYTFRLIISNYDRTMTAGEVNSLLDASTVVVNQQFIAQRK